MITFKKVLRITFSTAGLLLLVLLIHLYMVVPAAKAKANNVQLSRIDFLQQIDSTTAEGIIHFVNSLDGVQSSYFNREKGIFVYTFEQEKQTSENVFKKLMAAGRFSAQRYFVSKEQASGGCPAGYDNSNSLTGKMVNFIAKIKS
jgi:hypothetical protein